MKITLQNGRVEYFTREEIRKLKTILKSIQPDIDHFLLKLSLRELFFTQKEIRELKDILLSTVRTPTEGRWFRVQPLAIDQTLFQKEREDEKQEEARQLILEAFEELKNDPEKYGRNFKTMIPKHNYRSIFKTGEEQKEMARYDFDGHMANWVEQALEWAQRITNGESWEVICNKKDDIFCCRRIVWKDGTTMFVGGFFADATPATIVFYYDPAEYWFYINITEPLVATYDE